ncbi:MAG: type VI secretion system baseplate subunit TssF [Desulfobacteraceae bacterium]|nr:type VI secretion system baseplate subunit TssF [Desulfobacteraceae bacterium]
MFNHYFQQELSNLRDLGSEFSKKHPAVAPMLSGMSADPDVERLLEGVAFLTAMLRSKLDDDFPEIIHELFQLIWPHYLRPLPATSLIAFDPGASLTHTVTVPKGTMVSTDPKKTEGTPCNFKTCYDVDVHPVTLEKVSLSSKPGQPLSIDLDFELKDAKMEEWQPDVLRFHLGGDVKQAAEIYLLLMQYLVRVVITQNESGIEFTLPKDSVKPAGFSTGEDLVPYPSQVFPGYRIIQEYFILPEKFLFFDLKGLKKWQRNLEDKNFTIKFVLKSFPQHPPKPRLENFVLSATPIVNIFDHDADPIRLDHRQFEYIVRPAGSNDLNYQVYSVTNVTGFIQGTAKERTYFPFEVFLPATETGPTYHTNIRQSPVRQGFDFYLSVAYPPGDGALATETLSVQLQCTNGVLTDNLQIGDICVPGGSMPGLVEFKNIRPPTSAILPPIGKNLLWKLLSHLCLNYKSLNNIDNLKALLSLYNFEENPDRPAFLANQKRLTGLQNIKTAHVDSLVNRIIMRGQEIHLDIRSDHFAGLGDLYLFSSVLDHFLGSYASLNSFTRLYVKETLKGEVYQWPARLGDHPLI